MRFASRKCNLTPREPIIQGGYAAQRNHPYEYVNDEIEGRIFCLTINKEKIVWVSVDFTGLEEEIISEIIEKVNGKGVNLKKENFVINFSHTHCGPATNRTASVGSMIKAPEEYIQYYENILVENIVSAIEDDGVEVKTRFSSFVIDGIYSNRNNINKPSNKNVYFVGFFDEEEKLVGMLYSMSHHCTVLGPNMYGLSADLFGCLRRALELKYQTTVSIMQGSAGDMGNRQYRDGNDYGAVERETKRLIEQIDWRLKWEDIDLESFEVQEHVYTAKYYHDAKQYEEKIADFTERLKTEKDFDMIKLLQAGMGGFKRKLAVPSGEYVKDMPYQIINIGDLQIITIPGEFGSYLALRIIAASKAKHCMIWGYSNGRALGYMIEKEAFDQFSQEANVTIWPAGICDDFTQDVISNL